MLSDVAQHYTHIYEQKNGRLLLVKRNGRAKFSVVELQPHGSCYGVTTLFLEDANPRGQPYEQRGGTNSLWPLAEAASSGSDATFPAAAIGAGAGTADASESIPSVAPAAPRDNAQPAAEAITHPTEPVTVSPTDHSAGYAIPAPPAIADKITAPSIARRANPGNMGDQSFVSRAFIKQGDVPIMGSGSTAAEAVADMHKAAERKLPDPFPPRQQHRQHLREGRDGNY